jgi:hypothetical protein
MGMRAEEIGKSECQPVTGWIRVAAQANITRPEREQTSDGSFLTKNLKNLERRKSK